MTFVSSFKFQVRGAVVESSGVSGFLFLVSGFKFQVRGAVVESSGVSGFSPSLRGAKFSDFLFQVSGFRFAELWLKARLLTSHIFFSFTWAENFLPTAQCAFTSHISLLTSHLYHPNFYAVTLLLMLR
jgi:hypothetical protein